MAGPLVDIRRGDRAYIRAADIIAAAPTDGLTGPVRFRFPCPADRPGRWVPAVEDPDSKLIAATMTLASGELEWHFRFEQPATPLRAAADLDKAALLRGISPSKTGASCPVFDPLAVLDQLILLVRDRWQADFPAGLWSVAVVDIRNWPMTTPSPGSTLSTERTKLRRRALEVDFAFDGRPIGSILFSIAIAGASDAL